MIGMRIYNLCERLFPINRSITGDGVRETLRILREILPNMNLVEVPSGTQAFDWIVPMEWRVRDAYIISPSGKKICDFRNNNLHLVGYSMPVHTKICLDDLQKHLYSLPDQPTAIPYITSYYNQLWGFCLSQVERDSLEKGEYEVFIDTDLFNGSLTYGELLISGESDKEILISTYICHPSMANNELSGPTVTAHLAEWISKRDKNKFSYRVIFIPETIGSITYLSKNLSYLKSHVIAGFNITCIGDDRNYSYLPSRNGSTISDHVAKHCLKHICPTFKSYKWNDRGSDERQYCAPGIDLPIASVMRTKYGVYDEYHTSHDNLKNVVTPTGLEGGYNILKRIIEAFENNSYPRVTILCEPQLSKRGLYPTLSTKNSWEQVRLMMDLITWSDGTKSLLEIAEECNYPIWDFYPIIEKMAEHKLIELYDQPFPY